MNLSNSRVHKNQRCQEWDMGVFSTARFMVGAIAPGVNASTTHSIPMITTCSDASWCTAGGCYSCPLCNPCKFWVQPRSHHDLSYSSRSGCPMSGRPIPSFLQEHRPHDFRVPLLSRIHKDPRQSLSSAHDVGGT